MMMMMRSVEGAQRAKGPAPGTSLIVLFDFLAGCLTKDGAEVRRAAGCLTGPVLRSLAAPGRREVSALLQG